ncbi:MAG: F0F1 ATP synthase subunit B [Oscillospiraceae bacterium]|nr:F0F1 ATP synthase subunit B [Oscillospiraceae bacterium]
MLGFLSIDIGTILFTLANTLILFLGIRHFLFKPVNNVLEARQAEVDKSIKAAEEAKANAEAAEQEYREKLTAAKEEAQTMLRNATRKAQQREEEIIASAKAEAAGIMKQNQAELEREKRSAERALRSEVSGLALMVAEKVVEREIKPEDHARLIDEFINSVGDAE